MIQTGLIQSAHNDLVTDVSYDFYGLRLATCGLDQRIKVWQIDETNGTWRVEDDWKAHDAAISRLSWAHPEFGTIIASASFDRTIKVWEQTAGEIAAQPNGSASSPAGGSSSTRWVERASLVDARGTVRAVEFAPRHFGLKLASISSDNHLRVYECLEQTSLATWQLAEEVDVLRLPSSSSPSSHSVAFATPTQTHATLEGASASLVAQAIQQSQAPPAPAPSGQLAARPGLGNREADGGWALAWCKERYWGEVLAVGAGTGGAVKIVQLSSSRRPTTLLTLDPAPPLLLPSSASDSGAAGASGGTPGGAAAEDTSGRSAITSIAWAPSCGRSYHLIATGGRDGRVRIWKLAPPADSDAGLGLGLGGEMDVDGSELGGGEPRWSGSVVAEFDQHKSAVGRVEWNITGTLLSSAGNDGRVRLWKASVGNVWKPAGSIGVEQGEDAADDVDMDGHPASN